MEIKKAAETNIPGLIRLWMEFMYFNSNAEPLDISPENIPNHVADHFKERINSPDSLIIVALEDEKVVGYIVADVSPRSALEPDVIIGNINDLSVTASHRGKGVGRMMLKQVKDWFKTRDVNDVQLNAITKKIIDKSFWEKEGVDS